MSKSYLICVDADGYEVSLQARKVYARLADGSAEAEGMVRVIDETGEDYLYPAERFVPLELPSEAEAAFRRQPATA